MKILFVCKSNVGRSQMAEAFFSRLAPEHHVKSAGIHVLPENEGKPISEYTEKVPQCMQELGYEVGGQIMNQVTQAMVKDADKVIAITTEDNLPDFVKKSPKLEVWAVPDAGGTDLEFHRKVRNEIKKRITDLIDHLPKGRQGS